MYSVALFSKKKVDAIALREMYQETFGSAAGKYVLQDICKRFHVMSSAGADATDDKIRFREGERNVALFLLAMVDCDLNEFRKQRAAYQLEKVSYDDGHKQ
jgi:hypothetical protein